MRALKLTMVVLGGHFPRRLDHFESSKLVPAGLEPSDDVGDETALHAIGLDHDKGTLRHFEEGCGGRERSFRMLRSCQGIRTYIKASLGILCSTVLRRITVSARESASTVGSKDKWRSIIGESVLYFFFKKLGICHTLLSPCVELPQQSAIICDKMVCPIVVAIFQSRVVSKLFAAAATASRHSIFRLHIFAHPRQPWRLQRLRRRPRFPRLCSLSLAAPRVRHAVVTILSMLSLFAMLTLSYPYRSFLRSPPQVWLQLVSCSLLI